MSCGLYQLVNLNQIKDLMLEMSTPSEQEINEIVRKVIASFPQALVASPTLSHEKTVAIGADHGGFPLKEALKTFLAELGYTMIDCGTNSTAAVDYPDLARAVAELVSAGKAWRGVMIDGAGIGSCMAANKVPGVRASMCYDLSTASNAREHNNANVLTLGAGLIGEAWPSRSSKPGSPPNSAAAGTPSASIRSWRLKRFT